MAKVKICGITNIEDAANAARLGADYLGFNFYKKSPRFIDAEIAQKVLNNLGFSTKKVAVFVNEDLDKAGSIVKQLNFDLIQLHGDESPEYCAQLKKKAKKQVIKAFRIKDKLNLNDFMSYDADYYMFDAHKEGQFGGTGKTFDWSLLNGIKKPFFLSGRLNPGNVKEAIKMVNPFAVDVASGVESKIGKKDYKKMKDFIDAAKH